MDTTPFAHATDIKPDSVLDHQSVSEQMGVAVYRTIDAFERAKPVPPLAGSYVVHHLKQFLATHHSMRLLIVASDKDKLLVGDAVSLAREQVEKVFVIALMLDDPVRWGTAYQRYGWRKFYEEHILKEFECQHLERFADFLTQTGPPVIENLRKMAKVTPEEMAATRDRFENELFGRNAPLPAHLEGHVIQPFPTPGIARHQIGDPGSKEHVNRWYFTWKQLCDYSHIGDDKIVLAGLLGRSSPIDDYAKISVFEREVLGPLTVSATATASAVTEVASKCEIGDADMWASVVGLWNLLEGTTLTGALFWELRARHLVRGLV